MPKWLSVTTGVHRLQPIAVRIAVALVQKMDRPLTGWCMHHSRTCPQPGKLLTC